MKVWKEVQRIPADDILSQGSSHAFHEPIPGHTAQVPIVNDDPFGGLGDDLKIELICISQRLIHLIAPDDVIDYN
jgi:hypothetical protein